MDKTLNNKLIKQLINQIILKYNPNKHLCSATVNPYISNAKDRDNLEIACMLTKHKDIYMTFNPKFLSKIDPLLLSLLKYKKITKKIKKVSYFLYYLSEPVNIDQKIIMMPSFIKEKKILLYTKKGLKNALIMRLNDLEANLKEFQEPGSYLENDNHYLTGLLLNYKKSDIRFFYLINFFRDSLEFYQDIEITDNNPFFDWPERIKIDFQNFIKKNWQKSQYYKIYKQDKKEAVQIISKYKNLSLKDINNLIKHNYSKIRNLIKDKFK